MTSRPVQVGLIGVGRWGKRLLDQLTELGAKVACYPGSSVTSRESAQRLGTCRIVGSVDDLFASQTIDVIIISTPPESHADLAMASLRAGKHTFVEKPLCLEFDELRSILDAARSTGQVLFTGYSVSFHPVVRELARLATQDDVRALWSYRCKTGSFASDIVSTLLVHDLAVAVTLAGDFSEWSVVERTGATPDPDAIALSFATRSGARGLLRADRSSPESRRELSVTIGKRTYRWDGGAELLEFVDGAFRVVFSDPTPALEVELRELLEIVTAGAIDEARLEREGRLAGLAIAIRKDVVS